MKRIITCCLVCCGEQQGGRHSGEVEGEAYDVPGSVRGRVQVIKRYYPDWLFAFKENIFDDLIIKKIAFSELASQPPKKKNKSEEEWKAAGSGKNKVLTAAPTIDSLYFRSYNS